MDKGYEKEGFKTFKIKASVAIKFRRFCKKMSQSQSMTLRLMITFFENNGISPNESLGPKMQTMENLIKKRINGVISIIKDIEKNQTKPTNAMLLSLFEENLKQEKKEPALIEKKFAHKSLKNKPIEDTTVPKIRYNRLSEKMDSMKQDFSDVLDKVQTVKSSFGKSYLKLELTEAELIKLKRRLRKIQK